MNRSAHNQASITSTPWSGLSSRLAYVGYLTMVALCSVLAFMSLLRGELELLLGSVVAGVFALGFRALLRNLPRQPEADGVDENDLYLATRVHGPTSHRLEIDKLVALLHELDGLEQARGSKRFDPWALQSTRSEIRAAVNDNAALRRLFSPDR